VDIILFILAWGVYGFLAHLIAKRGERTGLFYNRVLFLALITMPITFIYVFFLRNPRGGNYQEQRLPNK
jgi:hypothetical protein